jgi:hypothetical protein
MDWRSLVPTLQTVGTSAAGALIAVYLKDWIEERRMKRETMREKRRMRILTDRDTYKSRLTVLIRSRLATFIRHDRWCTGQNDLDHLLDDLDNGNYERFLDKDVNRLWQKFCGKSVVLARARLNGTISQLDIRMYNLMRHEWEDAAKRSFGPLPKEHAVLQSHPRNRSEVAEPSAA